MLIMHVYNTLYNKKSKTLFFRKKINQVSQQSEVGFELFAASLGVLPLSRDFPESYGRQELPLDIQEFAMENG